MQPWINVLKFYSSLKNIYHALTKLVNMYIKKSIIWILELLILQA